MARASYPLFESEPPEPKLAAEVLEHNFREIRPPLGDESALREAQRCYYCDYDAPCVRGCPTRIDIPSFIKLIAQGKPVEAGRVIVQSNILGASCARVCPVDMLCEKHCICTTLHERPIPVGRLQRVAMDSLMQSGEQPFERAPATGRTIAVVGAGPAGISAAFELAKRGHEVRVLEKDAEPGGLDRYGIAEYKVRAPFVREELDWLLRIGGVALEHVGQPVGSAELRALMGKHSAVLLALGLATTRRLGIAGEGLAHVVDALRFIRQIKMGPLADVPVGRHVVVIGAGNTAIDAATQARRLGAESVLLVHRGGRHEVSCTPEEFALSLADGCEWRWFAEPVEILGEDRVRAVLLRDTRHGGISEVAADHVVKAIGQTPHEWLRDIAGLALEPNQTLKVDPITWMTSVPGLFAAGDCVLRAKEVVHAVYEGKCAALAIDGWLAPSASR